MKKFFTRLLLAAVALAAPKASAYTVDEIIANGTDAIANYKTSYKVDKGAGNYAHSEGVTISKYSDTSIKISGIWEDDLDFVFTLSNNGSSAATNGTKLILYYKTAALNNKNFRFINADKKSGNPYYSSTRDYWVFDILEDEDGVLYFKSQSPACLAYDGSWNRYQRMYDEVEIKAFKPNAQASDRLVTYNWYANGSQMVIEERDSRERQYPMIVDFDGDRVSFTNLGNEGYAINGSNLSTLNATLREDNVIDFDKMQFGKVYIDFYGESWYGDTLYNVNIFEYIPFQIERLALDTGEPEDVLYANYNPGVLAHNGISHHWVTNDGLRRTYEDFQIVFDDPYTYYYDGLLYEVLNMMDGYYDTSIQGDRDVTVDVDLVLSAVGCDNDKNLVRAVGQIVTNKNDKYVDHYELCVVPGRYTSINDHEGFLNASAEHGHTDATNIYSSDYDYHGAGAKTMARIESSNVHDYSFDKIMNKSEIGGNAANNYTFYIKTVYTADSNLAPTFHSMQSIQSGTTGIDGVEFDDIDAQPEYYNLQGVRVMEPEKGCIYIVRRGTSASKEIY